MSYAEQGKSISEPVKIPKHRLLGLLKESLDQDQKLALSAFNPLKLDRIVLMHKSVASIYWNTELKNAQVVLSGKKYPIPVSKGSPEMILRRKYFKGVADGKYLVALQVRDFKGRINQVNATVHILPWVKVTANKLVYDGKIQFEKNKAIIKAASYPLLEQIIDQVNTIDNISTISVEGHTDSKGASEYNLILSRQRANAVKQYLIDHWVSEAIVSAKGFGESKPVSTNTTLEGRKNNRRVEFVIQQTKDTLH